MLLLTISYFVTGFVVTAFISFVRRETNIHPFLSGHRSSFYRLIWPLFLWDVICKSIEIRASKLNRCFKVGDRVKVRHNMWEKQESNLLGIVTSVRGNGCYDVIRDNNVYNYSAQDLSHDVSYLNEELVTDVIDS